MHRLAYIRFDSQQFKTQKRSQSFCQTVLASMSSPFTFDNHLVQGIKKRQSSIATTHPYTLGMSISRGHLKESKIPWESCWERRKPCTSYRGNLPPWMPFSHSSDNSGSPCRRNWSKDKDGSVVDKSSPAPRTGLVIQGSCPHLELNLTPVP